MCKITAATPGDPGRHSNALGMLSSVVAASRSVSPCAARRDEGEGARDGEDQKRGALERRDWLQEPAQEM